MDTGQLVVRLDPLERVCDFPSCNGTCHAGESKMVIMINPSTHEWTYMHESCAAEHETTIMNAIEATYGDGATEDEDILRMSNFFRGAVVEYRSVPSESKDPSQPAACAFVLKRGSHVTLYPSMPIAEMTRAMVSFTVRSDRVPSPQDRALEAASMTKAVAKSAARLVLRRVTLERCWVYSSSDKGCLESTVVMAVTPDPALQSAIEDAWRITELSKAAFTGSTDFGEYRQALWSVFAVARQTICTDNTAVCVVESRPTVSMNMHIGSCSSGLLVCVGCCPETHYGYGSFGELYSVAPLTTTAHSITASAVPQKAPTTYWKDQPRAEMVEGQRVAYPPTFPQ